MAAQVVVVEDDAAVRELLELAFETVDIRILSCHHPRSALQLDPHRPPVVFLIDLMLPGMSGIDLAKDLRARGFTTPIIGISASRLMLHVAAGSGLFDDTISKPFELDELIDVIQRAIMTHSAPARAQVRCGAPQAL